MPSNNNQHSLWSLQNDGETSFIGMPLPQGVRSLQLKSLSPGSQKLLWVVEGTLKALPLLGWKENKGTTYLALPLPEGRSAHALPAEPVHQDLLRLLSALAVLETENSEQAQKILGAPLRIGGILLPEAGGVAFLEPDFAQRMLSLCSSDTENAPLIHPGPTGNGAALFSSAVLAYRGLSGESPFRGEEEDLRERILRGVFIPLPAQIPAVAPDLAEWIHRGLLGRAERGSFAEGVRLLEAAGPDGLDPAFSPEEKEHRRLAAEKEAQSREKRYGTRRFFRRRGALILAALAVAGALGALGGSILSGVFAPPLTRGWEPREVIEGFYRGINELDPELVDGVTMKKAGKERNDQVIHLFAISRIRLGYEGVSPFVNAEEWLTREDRHLEPGEVLYGIAGLSLEELEENRFRATYQEWSALPPEDSENQQAGGTLIIKGQRVTEELTLEWTREAWLISRIEVIDSRDIPYPTPESK